MDAVTSPVFGHRWSPPVNSSDPTVLDCSAATHTGMVRRLNEDAFLVGPPVFVLADGMGGYAMGDVASSLVVAAFEPLAGRQELGASDLTAAIARSRTEISALPSDAGAPGSTVIAAAYVIESGREYWLIAHEGDSRAYTWRAGALRQVTRDHSLVQELVDSGEIAPDEARLHPERHVVTRAVGALIDTEPDFTLVPAEPGSRLLLCTDGLTSELSSASIATLLGQSTSSRDAVERLLEAAVAAGGHDNVTVLVVDVVATGEQCCDDTLSAGERILEDTAPGARRRA